MSHHLTPPSKIPIRITPTDHLLPRIEQLGPSTHVASMGDLKARSNIRAQQSRQHHDKKVQKNMALLGQSIKIAGDVVPKIPGTRKVTKSITGALSGVVKLGATAMKDDEGKTQTWGGGHQGASAPIGELPQLFFSEGKRT